MEPWSRGVEDTTRKPAESTNLGPQGLTEAELPIREHAQDRPRPSAHHVTVVQLGLPVRLLQWEQGLPLTILPTVRPLSPNWAAPSSLNRRRCF